VGVYTDTDGARVLRVGTRTVRLREADFATAETITELEARLGASSRLALACEVLIHLFSKAPLHYSVHIGPAGREPLFKDWWDARPPGTLTSTPRAR
jgi:hypothetical protein